MANVWQHPTADDDQFVTTSKSRSKGKAKQEDDDNAENDYDASVVEPRVAREQVNTLRYTSQRGSENTFMTLRRSGKLYSSGADYEQGEYPQHYASSLDSAGYKRHHSRYFLIGSVLKVVWYEPPCAIKQDTESGDDSSSTLQSRGLAGKVRRFVIIETYRGHSTCIPISTYGLRGTTKPGCHPEDHAMIYTGSQPQYLAGEELPHPKIKVETTGGQTLARESRVNYAKKYKIEHNSWVKFMGYIAQQSRDDFWMALNIVNYRSSAPPPTVLVHNTSSQSESGRHKIRAEVDGSSSTPSFTTPMQLATRAFNHRSKAASAALSNLIPKVDTADEQDIVLDMSEDDSLDGFISDEGAEETEDGTSEEKLAHGAFENRPSSPLNMSPPEIGEGEVLSEPLSGTEHSESKHVFIQDNSQIAAVNLECQKDLFVSWPDSELKTVTRRLGEPLPGTCEWLLKKSKYVDWLTAQTPQILRVAGGLETGRTTLVIFLVEQLKKRLEATPGMVLAYHFCDCRNHSSNTETGIVRQLLFQLYQQRPKYFHYLQKAYDIQGHKLFQDWWKLWEILITTLEDVKDCEVFIIVDALSECDERSRRDLLWGLNRMGENNVNVRFLFTDRLGGSDYGGSPESAVHDLKNIVTLPIKPGDIKHDVERVVEGRLSSISTQKGWDAKRHEFFKELVLEKGFGAFPMLLLETVGKIRDEDDIIRFLFLAPRHPGAVYGQSELHLGQYKKDGGVPNYPYISTRNRKRVKPLGGGNVFDFLDKLPGTPGANYRIAAEGDVHEYWEYDDSLPSTKSGNSTPVSVQDMSEKDEIFDDLASEHSVPERPVSEYAPSTTTEHPVTSPFQDSEPGSHPSSTRALDVLSEIPLKHAIVALCFSHACRTGLNATFLFVCRLGVFTTAASVLFAFIYLIFIAIQSRHLPATFNTQAITSTPPDANDPAQGAPAPSPSPPTSAFIGYIIHLHNRVLNFIQTDRQNDPNGPPPPPDPNDLEAQFCPPNGLSFWVLACLAIFAFVGIFSIVTQTIASTRLQSDNKRAEYIPPTRDDTDHWELLSSSGFVFISCFFSFAITLLHIREHNDSTEWFAVWPSNLVCLLTIPVSIKLYVHYKWWSKAISSFGNLMQVVVNFLTLLKLEELAQKRVWSQLGTQHARVRAEVARQLAERDRELEQLRAEVERLKTAAVGTPGSSTD